MINIGIRIETDVRVIAKTETDVDMQAEIHKAVCNYKAEIGVEIFKLKRIQIQLHRVGCKQGWSLMD